VFIADLTLVPNDYTELFSKLADQFPDLVLMAAGSRNEERLARPLLSNGQVYRFIHMPVSHARAASFMAAAIRRHGELKALQTTMLSTMKTLATAKPRWSIGITTAVALVAVIIAAASFHFRSVQVVQPTIATPITTSTQSGGLNELLANARVLMASRHFITPDHRGALDLYHAATLVDSTNAEAQSGLQQALDAVLEDAGKALRERNVNRALEDIAAVKRVRPTHPHLPMLESRAAQLSLSRRYPKAKPQPAVAQAEKQEATSEASKSE
jgi:hypothetical protein